MAAASPEPAVSREAAVSTEPDIPTEVAGAAYFFASMHQRCVNVRRKICPFEIAGDEFD